MTIKLAQQLKLPKPFNAGPHASHFISPSSTNSKDAPSSGRRNSKHIVSHVIRKHTQHHKHHHSHTPISKKSAPHEPKSKKQKFNYVDLLKQQMKEEQIQQNKQEMTPAQLMAEFHPTPMRRSVLDTKFTYFYKPYNYIANTQKFMKFQEEPTPEILEEHKALEPCWSNLGVTPWTQSRPESTMIHKRAIEEFTKDLDDCQTWRDVHNFMFSGDENTFTFVRNQLMRMLGVKKTRKKKEKKRFNSSIKNELLLNRTIIRARKDSFRSGKRSHSPDSDSDEQSQRGNHGKKKISSSKTSPDARRNASRKNFMVTDQQKVTDKGEDRNGSKDGMPQPNKQRNSAGPAAPLSSFAPMDFKRNQTLNQAFSMPIQEVEECGDESSYLHTEVDSTFTPDKSLHQHASEQKGSNTKQTITQTKKIVIPETDQEHNHSSSSNSSASNHEKTPKLDLNSIAVKKMKSFNSDDAESKSSQEVDARSRASSSFFHKSIGKKEEQTPRSVSDDGKSNMSSVSGTSSKRRRARRSPKFSARMRSQSLAPSSIGQFKVPVKMEKYQSKIDKAASKRIMVEEDDDSIDSDNYASDSDTSIKKARLKASSRTGHHRLKHKRQVSHKIDQLKLTHTTTEGPQTSAAGLPLKFTKGRSTRTMRSIAEKQVQSLAVRLANAIRTKMSVIIQEENRRVSSSDGASLGGRTNETVKSRFFSVKASSIVNIDQIPQVSVQKAQPQKQVTSIDVASVVKENETQSQLLQQPKRVQTKITPRGIKSKKRNSRGISNNYVIRSNSSRKKQKNSVGRRQSYLSKGTTSRQSHEKHSKASNVPIDLEKELDNLSEATRKKRREHLKMAKFGSLVPELRPETKEDLIQQTDSQRRASVRRGATEKYLEEEEKDDQRIESERTVAADQDHSTESIVESPMSPTKSPSFIRAMPIETNETSSKVPVRKLPSQPLQGNEIEQGSSKNDLKLMIVTAQSENDSNQGENQEEEMLSEEKSGKQLTQSEAIINADNILKSSPSESNIGSILDQTSKLTSGLQHRNADQKDKIVFNNDIRHLDSIGGLRCAAAQGVNQQAVAVRKDTSSRQQQVVMLRKRHAQKPVLHDFTKLLTRWQESSNQNQQETPMMTAFSLSHDDEATAAPAINISSNPVMPKRADLKSLLATGLLQKQIKAKLDHDQNRAQAQSTKTDEQQSRLEKLDRKDPSPPRELGRPSPLRTKTEDDYLDVPTQDGKIYSKDIASSEQDYNFGTCSALPSSAATLSRNLFSPGRRRHKSNMRTIETKLQPIIDQYYSIATQTQKSAQSSAKLKTRFMSQKKRSSASVHPSAASTLPTSAIRQNQYNQYNSSALQMSRPSTLTLDNQLQLNVSNFNSSSRQVINKTQQQLPDRPNETNHQQCLYLGNDPQVMDQLLINRQLQQRRQYDNGMLASCSSRLVGSTNGASVTYSPATAAVAKQDDDYQNHLVSNQNSTNLMQNLQQSRFVSIFHQRTKSAGNHRRGGAHAAASTFQHPMMSGCVTPISSTLAADNKQQNHFSQGRMTSTFVDDRPSQFLTKQFASTTSNGSLMLQKPSPQLQQDEQKANGCVSSLSTFLISPEVRVLDQGGDYRQFAEHHRNRQNQSQQQLGQKKRSLKAKMHPNAIQSYLGLAITDPIQMIGLHKSNITPRIINH